MHNFTDIVSHCTDFTLGILDTTEKDLMDKLQDCAETKLVKSLQMVRLQYVILAVGMFSIFEAFLHDQFELEGPFSFAEAEKVLDREGEAALKERFINFRLAINALKHGSGKSYDKLVAKDKIHRLQFLVKHDKEDFFDEGDVSEVSTLIDVDGIFVCNCLKTIHEVAVVIERSNSKYKCNDG